jgi:hypothetical protein
LKDAAACFALAYERARELRDPRAISESLAQLLRYSSEIGDESGVEKWINELEIFVAQSVGPLSPQIWYCKGIIAFRSTRYRKAQILFHRFWREVEREEDSSDPGDAGTRRDLLHSKCRALLACAVVAQNQGKLRRSRYLGEVILSYAERERPRGILSSTYLMLCRTAEKAGDLVLARKWLQKAFAESVSEHNWYHYLYVLYGFAVLSRLEQDFIQARFYLDLLEKAVVQEELRNLRLGIAEERVKLNLNRVDLEIDLERSVIRTREGEHSLRRQRVLMDIVHRLALAHGGGNGGVRQGLQKSQIIEMVWQEKYHPEEHDGKLYYNINRIRKLMEPDQRNPRYIQNWRQGYRLAPELRVRIIPGEGQ